MRISRFGRSGIAEEVVGTMGNTAWAIAVSTLLFLGAASAADKPELRDEKDRISYSVGYQVGGDFKRQGVELDPELLLRGARDALSGADPLMSSKERSRTLVDLKRKIELSLRETRKSAAERNLAEGKRFLEDNSRKAGVTTLPSGLQYRVIREGTGRSPSATDNVTVHYRGTLIDGTEFDSSLARGKPATFRVGDVIRGWTEALQRMKVGSKWQLFIPPSLAYGERGAGSRIGPNATLVFEVELISLQTEKK